LSALAKPDRARVFFALWPEPAVRERLAAATRIAHGECGGRATAPEKLHLTLIFLGAIDRARLPAVRSIASAIAIPAFELHLTKIGWWRHNRLVWAGGDQCPPALQTLVSSLQSGLGREGYALDERPYAPHVTLLRNALRGPTKAAIAAVAWPVHDFALVESVAAGGGVRYEVLAQWPLCAP
jgi:2'-5' RNA ligase